MENYGIAFTALDCSFGKETSIASIKKSVSLSVETLSRVPSPADFKKLLQQVDSIPGIKVKIASYPGLGSEGFLLTFSEAGLNIETLTTGSGTKLYGATVESSSSASKLATLVKLAEKL